MFDFPAIVENVLATVDDFIPQYKGLDVQPEHWANICYYETDVGVGEPFKVASELSTVKIDGYLDPSSDVRFCLGQLTNVHRRKQSERCRLHIGRGIQLVRSNNGDIWLRVLSSHPIFIESQHLDKKAGKENMDVVHKIYPNCYIKIFDLKESHTEMWKRFLINKRVLDQYTEFIKQGRDAFTVTRDAISCLYGVDDLRKLCVLLVWEVFEVETLPFFVKVRFFLKITSKIPFFPCISLVKGWGKDYIRTSIKQCPCWLEITVNDAMKRLDQVLLQSGVFNINRIMANPTMVLKPENEQGQDFQDQLPTQDNFLSSM